MKIKVSTALFCAAALLAAHSSAASVPSPFRNVDESTLRGDEGERVLVPARYRTLALDRDVLMQTLAQAPLEFTPDAADKASAVILALPMPDGSTVQFRVEESPIMEPGLAAQFPDIKTYRGQGLDDPTATTRFGWTSAGFHAIVLAERGTVFIDPYRRGDVAHYISYFKRDYTSRQPWRCLLDETVERFSGPEGPPAFAPSGDTLRTYRLAVAANVEYSTFQSAPNPPNKPDVLNRGIIPTMNRVNGVYERDVAVRMVLVASEMNVIFLAEPDGYTNNNPSQMLNANQAIVDGAIGFANYDIGHIFSTQGGGIAALRVPCGSSKARGVTGITTPTGDPFDIDYVAHEMGHQFGGNHTFNSAAGACQGNGASQAAYEVGSGSTIMAYAGICAPDDLQPHSDDYFHNVNFVEIQSFTTTPSTGDSCPVRTATGNQAPVVDAGPAFNIPSRTPFALTATGSDPNGNPLTFNWEEFDRGPFGDGRTDNGSSPILRSFNSTVSPTRIFPRLSDILGNLTTYGEILPTTTRTMTFRVTARDNRAGGGGVDWDSTTVSVQGAAGPFRVTSPNTNVSWNAGSVQTVTWSVAGTNAAPINTASVNIWLSVDGGLTFPTALATNAANDGSQTVTLPNTPTTTARVMVVGAGNIFFDVSDLNFTIVAVPAQFAVPIAIAIDASGNGVLETGETASMAPTWRNDGTSVLAGVTGAITGLAGGTIPDAAASYGTITVGNSASCTATGNCYSLAQATRGTGHFDTAVTETLSPSANTKVWTLHVGRSFTDVPVTNPFYRFVETILHKNVTGGCATSTYCPSAATTREQMAVFVLVAKEPAGFVPPACGTSPMFTDVPVSSPFCRWIEELARRGVVSGCGTGLYCPAAPATREQMAVFVLRTLDPTINPTACGVPVFADVPATSAFCRWIEELARRGVVSGCGGGNYCPADAVSREQMSVFLSVTFGLVLYGV